MDSTVIELRQTSKTKPPIKPQTTPIIPNFNPKLAIMIVGKNAESLNLEELELTPTDFLELLFSEDENDDKLEPKTIEIFVELYRVAIRILHSPGSSRVLFKPNQQETMYETIATCCEMRMSEHPHGKLPLTVEELRIRSSAFTCARLAGHETQILQYITTKRWTQPDRLNKTPRLLSPEPSMVVEMVNEFLKFVRDGMNGNICVNFIVKAKYRNARECESAWWDSYEFRVEPFGSWCQFFDNISNHKLQAPFICLIKLNEENISCHFVTEDEYRDSFLPSSATDSNGRRNGPEYILNETGSSLIWLCGTRDSSLNTTKAYLGMSGTRQRLWKGGALLIHLFDRFGHWLDRTVCEQISCEDIDLSRESFLNACWEDFPKFMNVPVPREIDVGPVEIRSIVPIESPNLRAEMLVNACDRFEQQSHEKHVPFLMDFNGLRDRIEKWEETFRPDAGCVIYCLKQNQQERDKLLIDMFRSRMPMRGINHYEHCVAQFPTLTSVMIMTLEFMKFVRDDRMAGRSCVNFLIHTRFRGQPNVIWDQFREYEFHPVGNLMHSFGGSWQTFFKSIARNRHWQAPCICLVDFPEVHDGDNRDIRFVDIHVHFVEQSTLVGRIFGTPQEMNGKFPNQWKMSEEGNVSKQTSTDYMWLYGILPLQSPYEHRKNFRLPIQAFLGYGQRRNRLEDGKGLVRILERFSSDHDGGKSALVSRWVERVKQENVEMDMRDLTTEWTFWKMFFGFSSLM